MQQLPPKDLVKKLESTLTKNGVDYQKLVIEFGQVAATEQRLRGQEFTFNDHIRGLVFAMLSNQRSWGPIAQNKQKITDIFLNFDAEKLEKANFSQILKKIIEIRCGNRSIGKQLEYLRYNINQLRRIVQEFGSMDAFVSHKPMEEIAKILSDQTSKYKLKQIGFTLAMEYLRNVGVRGMKPDLHLLRICGSERLAIFPKNVTPEQAAIIFNKFSEEASVNPAYLDNLFWIFGAKDYANICSARPKCSVCYLAPYCNYPNNRKSRKI